MVQVLGALLRCDLLAAPDTGLRPGRALVASEGANQQMEDLTLSLPLSVPLCNFTFHVNKCFF